MGRETVATVVFILRRQWSGDEILSDPTDGSEIRGSLFASSKQSLGI